ncbi:DUF3006 domain-containing protein [Listeria kieliensis]|uniref:Uncharacterized protein n=1 Tax=Listeria kieliensis TaxID=1621700 RepID=A0A3D8TTV0_9LIST|nr:DUF3006 domain-containing protein [Listeria kieliensis]RDX02229.1 hypothetical protein UR08_01490 [Listeria kieliensis]
MKREIKATLDRVEDGIAVFITSESEVSLEWPESELPSEIKEGDAVTICARIEKDEEATLAGEKRIADKLKKLRKKNMNK